MNKYVVTLLSTGLLLCSVSAHAIYIPLTDPPQTIMIGLKQIQEKTSAVQGHLDAVNALKRKLANGIYGLRQLSDLEGLQTMFISRLETSFSKSLGKQLSGSSLEKAFGSDLAGQLTSDDLFDINLDSLKGLGSDKLAGLTQDQLRDIVGERIAGKLSESQIRAMINDPTRLVDLLSGNTRQPIAPANQGVLELLGAKENIFDRKSAAPTKPGPNGNRSDAFLGSGNGSTAQAKESITAFKEVQKLVEKVQTPIDSKEIATMTAEQITALRKIQGELETEAAVSGLANAWVMQTLITRNMEKQLEKGKEKINAAREPRQAVGAASFLALMLVEAQNNASSLAAEDLKAVGTQVIKRGGSLTIPDEIAPKKTSEPAPTK